MQKLYITRVNLTRKTIATFLILIVSFAATTRADSPTSQPVTDTRQAFVTLIDRPKVPLSTTENLIDIEDGIAKYHFTFASEANQRVPGILFVKPEILKDGKQHPVAIVLHGTGGSKESESPTLRELATKNFIAVSIDGRYHGERGNQTDYNAAIAQAYQDGKSHPLYYDTVWDVMRLLDYLDTRPEVDPNRIGLMGISKGGIETWLTAAVDTRVAVTIPCISVQSFQWGLEHDAWHGRISTVQKGFDLIAKAEGIEHPDAVFVQKFYDRVIPGIYTTFDGPKMLPLIAPRPLLVINGDKDPMNPVPGLRLCEEAIKPAYLNAGVPQKFEVFLQSNTGHAVNKPAHAAAVAWFEKWLMR